MEKNLKKISSRIENNLKEFGFKIVALSELKSLSNAKTFSWNGFFLKEKSVYLEYSENKIDKNFSLPKDFEKKTGFLFKHNIICVFVFSNDFDSDQELREILYERILKAEASKNAVKLNDLSKILYSNTFSKKMQDIKKTEQKIDAQSLKKSEEEKKPSITPVPIPVPKSSTNPVPKLEQDSPSQEPPKGIKTIEYVLKGMSLKYSKIVSNPINTQQNYWNADLLITEPNVYISFCKQTEHFNKNEEKISLEEKNNFVNKKIKVIFLTNQDLVDETNLSKKIRNELDFFKKNEPKKIDEKKIIVPPKKTEPVPQKKELDKKEIDELENSIIESPPENNDELNIGVNFSTEDSFNSFEHSNQTKYSEDSDFAAIIGGLLIVLTIIFFLILIIVLVYVTFSS